MASPAKISLSQAFAKITEPWDPHLAGEVSGHHVKLALLDGAFDWHAHAGEDEAFLVIEGSFRMEFRDGAAEMHEGDLLVVPAGVEHRPVADKPCRVLLFEPAETRNTGDRVTAKTKTALKTLQKAGVGRTVERAGRA